MYNCFKCNQPYSSIHLLCKHIRYLHGWVPGEVLVCNQNECYRKFSHLDRYKRHLTNVHKYQIAEDSETRVPQNYNSLHVFNFKTQTSENINLESSLSSPDTLNTQKSFQKKLNHFRATVERSSLKFVSKLYSIQLLPTSTALDIMQSTQELISVLINCVKSFKKNYSDGNSELDSLLDFCESPFVKIQSEHLLLKELTVKGLYNPPKKFVINNKVSEKVQHGRLVLKEVKSEGVLMPIRSQIKQFFDAEDLLKKTLQNGNQLIKNKIVLTNFVQGELWQQKISLINKENVIPLFLFYDDFETNNPLGGRAGNQSIAAFYYSFPTIPQGFSKLSNIFVAMLVKSKIIKSFNYNKALAPLVDELKLLESHGIEFNTEEGVKKVYFVLGAIIGDNLGLNSILGFSQSFTHNFFCRLCSMKKEETQVCLKENAILARQKACYEEQILNINADTFRLTGVKDNCILNQIKTFHVTENFSVDIMHDVLEGVVKFGISNCLYSFIFEKHYFTIEELNNRIRNFEYGETQLSNRPGNIKTDHIKQKKPRVTARESLCLLEFISFYIGDLIPPTDALLKYIYTLQQLVQLIFKDKFSNYDIHCLQELIVKHNKLYMESFNELLKPKHHNLLHYPNIIRKSGPLKTMWCMRFESKHRELKYYTNAITSRRNLPLSIAKKCAIRFTFHMLKDVNFESVVSIIKFTETSKISLNISPFTELIEEMDLNLKEATLADVIEFNSTKYKIGYLIKSEDPDSFVLKISQIIIHRERAICILEKIKIENFDVTYQCFIIGNSLQQYCWLEMNSTEYKPPITLNKIPNGKHCFKIPFV